MNELEKNTLSTIAWFDIFDYPLTIWELYKYNFQQPIPQKQFLTFQKIQERLGKSEELRKIISYKDGFYFLRWRDDLVKIRKERYLITEQKYKKFFKIAKILAIVPFVRVIAVATGLSYANSKKEDDVDLFIIAAKNRIWSVRFFSILIIKIFKARPTLLNKKDKVCLNFFITEENLDLKKVCLLEKDNLPDIYFIYWMAWLYPIYQQKGIWQKFIQANLWLKTYLPFCVHQQPNKNRQVFLNYLTRSLKLILEIFFWSFFWHYVFSFLQRKILPNNIKKIVNKGLGVIVNDSILKFHDKDKRQEYRQKFYEKIKQVS